MNRKTTAVARRPVRAARPARPKARPSRRRDPERTKADILDVATHEFAGQGLSGARVDAIAARTKTSKRMIYYYFGSKEGLYLASLERVYGAMRAAEQSLDLDRLAPAEAIRRLVEYQFDYEESHPELIRLASVENIHDGKYLAQSDTIRRLNSSMTLLLGEILKRGRRDGSFASSVDPIDLHLLIIAPCFFRVSNRATFRALFGTDLYDSAVRARQKRMLSDAVVAYLQTPTPRAKPVPRRPRATANAGASSAPSRARGRKAG